MLEITFGKKKRGEVKLGGKGVEEKQGKIYVPFPPIFSRGEGEKSPKVSS